MGSGVARASVGRRWQWPALLLAASVVVLATAGGLRLASSGATSSLWESLPPPEFPLTISGDRRHLVDHDGKPFLIRGDAAWSLIAQLTREEAETYFQDRRKRGFNLLLVSLIEHHYADHAPSNAYGAAPFQRPGDFTRPNEAYFAHADWILRRAGELGFVVLLCPAYLGFEGNHEGWFQEMQRSGEGGLRSYGRFVGNRYRNFKNIIWLQGGDFSPPGESIALVNAVALSLRDAGANQLQAAHWAPEASAVDVATAGWLDINTTYTYRPVYLQSLVDHRRADRKPHFLIEGAYEEEHLSTPRTLRGQVYYALLTGAAGDVFGQRWVWKFKKQSLLRQFDGSWWMPALDTPGTHGVELARALFVSRNWPDLEPDVDNRLLVDGLGLHGGDLYAVAAATRDGRLAIVYVPSTRTVKVDVKSLALPARARWYDPTTGSFSDASPGRIETADILHFNTPEMNRAGETDWVLVIESAD